MYSTEAVLYIHSKETERDYKMIINLINVNPYAQVYNDYYFFKQLMGRKKLIK